MTGASGGREMENPAVRQQALIYAFVARDSVRLVEYTEFTGNFADVAHQCLTKLPPGNKFNKFAYNCSGYTFDYLVANGFTYCVVAVESVGRHVPDAFLDRVNEDFTKRYRSETAGDYREFGPKLKGHIQYCVDHAKRINKLVKLKEQVPEVKGVVVVNIEKVLDCGEKIDLLVTNNENLQSEVRSRERGKFFLSDEDVVVSSKERIDSLKLFPGKCYMSCYELSVLVKKAQHVKKHTYDIMKMFQHNTLIPYLNFYREANQGRLVIAATVEVSFQSWIRDNGRALLFDAYGNMTLLFKTILIDICDVVQCLRNKNIMIKNLDRESLYMAKEVSPRILVLVSECELLKAGVHNIRIWKPVQEILEWCFEQCKVQPNRHSARFIQFICSDNFSMKSLKRYPENWDSVTKQEYLLSLIAADDNNKVWSAVNGSRKFAWPSENGELPRLLETIRKHQKDRGWSYDLTIKYDYVKLIRDVHKHFFQLAKWIQSQCGGSPEGFIRMVEKWSPDIWVDLFDLIGWP